MAQNSNIWRDPIGMNHRVLIICNAHVKNWKEPKSISSALYAHTVIKMANVATLL